MWRLFFSLALTLIELKKKHWRLEMSQVVYETCYIS